MNVAKNLVNPEQLGMCSQRLERIPGAFQSYIDGKKLAGLQVMIARQGEVVHQSSLGVKDWDTGEAMTEDTIFRIYSMTKPITSVALMMLYEEGKIRLEHPLSRYIPEFSNLQVLESGTAESYTTRPAKRPILVRDLFTHTSGLTYGFMFSDTVDALYRLHKIGYTGSKPEYAVNLKGFVEKLATMPLCFDPGEHWNYSVATDVIGYLVELLSEQSLDEFFRQRIFEPLGMVDTGFYVPPEKSHRFATCYERPAGSKDIVQQDSPVDGAYSNPPLFLSGGGGLVATTKDYLQFLLMFANGGELNGKRLLSPTTVQFMSQNHLPDNQSVKQMGCSAFSEEREEGTGFGLGFSVVIDPVATGAPVSQGTLSWGGMASTYFWLDPVEDIIGIFMTQLIPSSTFPVRPQLQTMVNAAILESRA